MNAPGPLRAKTRSRLPLGFAATGVALAVLLGTLIPQRACAEDGEKPVVLFLKLYGDESAGQMEKRVSAQLKLTLFEFSVVEVFEGLDAFVEANLSGRLEVLKKMAAENNAVAIVWIEQGSQEVTLLNLVALSTGQALVRIVEAEKGPETPADLAVATQELLGQAYLFETASLRPEISNAVRAASEEVEAARQERGESEPEELRSEYTIGVSGIVRGAGVAHQGPAYRFGVGATFHHLLTDHLYWFPELSVLMTPEERTGGDSVSALTLSFGFGIGFKLQHKRIALGTEVSVDPEWHRTALGFEAEPAESEIWFNTSLRWGFGIEWHPVPRISIRLAPSVLLNAGRIFLHRESDNEVVYSNARVDWQGLLGVGYRI